MRLGESRMGARVCIGMLKVGEKRLSVARGRSSLTDDVSNDRGGERSHVRMGLSFRFMSLSTLWISAGDWSWNLLWKRPNSEGKESRDLLRGKLAS